MTTHEFIQALYVRRTRPIRKTWRDVCQEQFEKESLKQRIRNRVMRALKGA